MFLVDMHVHSTYSDGVLSIAELVDFYGRRGFGAIAITDHLCEQYTVLGRAAKVLGRTLTTSTYDQYLAEIEAQAQRALRRYDMVVIPGVELTKNTFSNKRSAHILALGLREKISADCEPLVLARKVRSLGALAVAAHPVPTRVSEAQTLYLWDQRERFRNEFDAWEVASGRHFFSEVAESGLPMLANSDLHVPSQIESWKTVLDCSRTEPEVLRAIRHQDLAFEYYREPSGVDLRPTTALHAGFKFADFASGFG